MYGKTKGLILGIVLVLVMSWTSSKQVQAAEWDGYDTTVISTGDVYGESVDSSVEEDLVRAGRDYVSITEEEAYGAIWAVADDYPEGMAWTNDNIYWSNSYMGGGGCHGFALIVSDAVFDHNRMQKYTDYAQLRVGDILRINNDTHTVVVLENHLDEGYIVVTEGNFGGRIHWGRKISKSSLDAGFVYGYSRYVEDNREQVQEFVKRMYAVSLGREAEKDGLKYWTDQLVYHENDGAGVAKGFIISDELNNKNLDNGSYVDILYRAFFGREAEASGRAYWIDKLVEGHSRYYVFCGFVNSGEFDEICAGYGILRGYLEQPDEVVVTTGIRDFVKRNYDLVLERSGDDEGIQYWCDMIASREMTPETVAMKFFFSDEYIQKNKSDTEYIYTLYRTFLEREPEDEGLHYWLQAIQDGTEREKILEGFSRSEEFQDIMARYGL